LASAETTCEGVDLEREGLEAPSSTWTYLVDDGMEQLGFNTLLKDPLSAAMQLPLYMVLLMSERHMKKKRLKPGGE